MKTSVKRFVAVSLALLMFFTVSVQNSVVFGQSTRVADPSTEYNNSELAAFPAVAAVAFGVTVVGAFAYGVYKGWQEAAEADQQGEPTEDQLQLSDASDYRYNLSVLEFQQYQKMDFARFDG